MGIPILMPDLLTAALVYSVCFSGGEGVEASEERHQGSCFQRGKSYEMVVVAESTKLATASLTAQLPKTA